MQGVCKTNHSVFAQLMGHSSLQTTSRYMANVSAAHRQAVVDLSAILNKKPENGSTECKTGTNMIADWKLGERSEMILSKGKAGTGFQITFKGDSF